MDNIDFLESFFGWCLAINFLMLTLAFLGLVLFRNSIKQIHSKMMGVEQEKLPGFYFSYLARYKIAIFVFNLAPYIALNLMLSI